MTEIILASSSPRRQRMLKQMGIEFTVVAPDADETPLPGELPAVYVERLARTKATLVAAPADALVIGADTTVDVDGEILGKPLDAADARRMLRRLSARVHHVHTGVAVRRRDTILSAVADTQVQFEPLTESAVEWYLATGEPYDRAGAYALQGAAGVFVTKVTGSVSNVVGLPLTVLVHLSKQVGVDLLEPPSR